MSAPLGKSDIPGKRFHRGPGSPFDKTEARDTLHSRHWAGSNHLRNEF